MKYKTHLKAKPCGRATSNSNFSDKPDEVNCMWCRANNQFFPIKVEEIKKKYEGKRRIDIHRMATEQPIQGLN